MYITTYSGKHFHLDDIEANEVDIFDIARALSNVCRFNGHCREFYSVLQHSYHVAWLVGPEFRLQALLHDASEAYLGDMIRPVKRILPQFKALEERVERHIFRTFGLPEELSPEVKHADNVLLATEMRDLMLHVDTDLPDPLLMTITPWARGSDFEVGRFLSLYHQFHV